MEILVVIIVIIFLWWWFAKPTSSPQSPRPLGSTTQPPPPPTKGTYRPTPGGSQGQPSIHFKSTLPGGGKSPTSADLSGLHDAFTGELLRIEKGLYQCVSCKVYYHSESFNVLKTENSSRCMACGSLQITSLNTTQAKASTGRDYTPHLVTLQNFRDYFGQVVTFQGTVQNINVSRRGLDYAVMFENKNWSKGFKLVFFRGAVGKVGGADFINSLDGRTIQVRGLLINHEKWGPEIIVTERSMILGSR